MQVHLAPSTLPAQATTKTMTSSMSGAHALKSWQTCLEEEKIKTLRSTLMVYNFILNFILYNFVEFYILLHVLVISILCLKLELE